MRKLNCRIGLSKAFFSLGPWNPDTSQLFHFSRWGSLDMLKRAIAQTMFLHWPVSTAQRTQSRSTAPG
jgi:hypothetical protein